MILTLLGNTSSKLHKELFHGSQTHTTVLINRHNLAATLTLDQLQTSDNVMRKNYSDTVHSWGFATMWSSGEQLKVILGQAHVISAELTHEE